MKLSEKQAAVLRRLQNAPGDGWVTTVELNNPECGTEGTKRLRELRAGGYDIEKRKAPTGSQYQYRLTRRTVSRP